MENEEQEMKSLVKVGGLVAICVVFLILIVFVWNAWTLKRSGELVLHQGVTYTGPTPASANQAPRSTPLPAKFTADESVKWKTVTGLLYPYSFEVPETLELVRFDNDPYDIYAISYNNQPPSSNVLIGVENLSNKEELKQYINQSKQIYVENWWKQIGALSGVSSISTFTNSKGMKGYRAKFLLQGGSPAPYDDIFFETPKRKDIVIHMANSILDENIFNRIVDTVSWGATISGTKK